MATSPTEIQPQPVAPSKLWFGLATAAAAWIALGFIDLMIVWQVCGYASEYGVERTHEIARVASFIISVALFALAFAAGFISYRNFRAVSGERDLINASATDRREFMAVLGVIVSVTLGVGIVWLAIPPLMIELCVRTK
jgi:hypothetical protein